MESEPERNQEFAAASDAISSELLGDAAGLFIVVTIAVTLPGLWLLNKADLHPEVSDATL